MKTWFNIFNLLGLVCMIFITDSLYHKVDLYENEYNEQRLIKSVEYASEKAFYDSIGSKSNQTDYENSVQVVTDPGKTLESFDTMMELNYGLSISEESDVCIEDSISGLSLITNDGYYLAKLQETGEDELRLYWTPKYPFTFEKKEGGTTYTYGVTLADETWYKASEDSSGTLKFEKGSSYADPGAAGALNDQVRKQAISQTLTDAMALAMEENSLTRKDNEYSLYIPSKQTLSGINDIYTPSFLVVVRDATYAGVDESLDAAITGLKVIRKIRTIGFKNEKGEYKYCYEGQQASDKYTILEYFDSPEDAARAGYTVDYRYIFRKIDTDYKKR